MFPNNISRWDFDTIMDYALRFLQFDLMTLIRRPLKCKAFEEETCSDKDEKEEIEKSNISKWNIGAPRKRYEGKSCYAIDPDSSNSQDPFNDLTDNDTYDVGDVGDSDCKEYKSGEDDENEDKGIVRNNDYEPNRNEMNVYNCSDEENGDKNLHCNESNECIGDDPNERLIRSVKDEKEELEKSKNAKRCMLPLKRWMGAKRNKYEGGACCVPDLNNNDNKDRFNQIDGDNDGNADDCDCKDNESGEDGEDEHKEIVRNNNYESNHNENNIYNSSDEVNANKSLHCNKSSECIVIEGNDYNDIVITEDDPRSIPQKKFHDSKTDEKSIFLNQSDWIKNAALKFYDSVRKISLKYDNMTFDEKCQTEENAKKLFQHMCGRKRQYKNSDWYYLGEWRQVPFFWAVLCEETFKDDPLENFKECFIMNAPHSSNMTIKAINEICLTVWHHMNAKQKLPFIMQAFIVKVASGKANPKDGDNLEKLVEHLECTTD